MKVDNKFEWPSFIVAGYRSIALVHNNKCNIIIEDNDVCYYGITWDSNYIYFGHRNKQYLDIGIVSVMDSDYNVIDQVPGNFPDLHQILYANDKLYITVTIHNSIAVFDGRETTTKNWTSTIRDLNHINSIWFDGKYFWVCYHNKVSSDKIFHNSQIVKMDKELTAPIEFFEFCKDIHNVYMDGEWMYTCDSASNRLYALNIHTKEQKFVDIGMWIRGLAVTDDHIIVGGSIIGKNDEERQKGDAKIYLLDRDTLKVLDIKLFKDVGAVYEIRIVNEHDYAHNGIKFPGAL
ncbi:hypothetical protein LCGC14_1254380 [marine sediment metagenome]|uniref:Uncharacterized protein n=1 Tax=marine sediment metagenome TaxID=412755 RepID=A0A0F9L5G8_9ZZZZ